MLSQNFGEEFVNTKKWNLFRERFKNPVTEASYKSDIREFCLIVGKPFEEADQRDVRIYYEKMSERAENGDISRITLTKKFRELHSFAAFLAECGRASGEGGRDDFYPYLRNMIKESPRADSIPVEHMDRLLHAASKDYMAYTMLTLMYRAGLTSTELIALKGEGDFIEYGEDIYVSLLSRKEPCYIPQDAWEIVKEYMNMRSVHDTLFYNRSGRPVNTMYISRMMKKYCALAGIPGYSAQDVRNSCAFNLFAYGATDEQTARQMGRTCQQIRRYRAAGYQENLQKQAAGLVKIRVEKPESPGVHPAE